MKYLTPSEVGDLLQLSKNTVYKMINQPDFPKIQIGKSYRIPYDLFEEYLSHYTYQKIDIDG